MSREVDEYLQTVPELSRGLVGRALTGNSRSPRDAIKAKCLDCSGFVREEAANCKVWRCPLYHMNPYRKEKA